MSERVKKECMLCGDIFIARNNKDRMCDKCREHNLNRTLYNLHKYNEENGTRLSYGQYRAKIETREIAI